MHTLTESPGLSGVGLVLSLLLFAGCSSSGDDDTGGTPSAANETADPVAGDDDTTTGDDGTASGDDDTASGTDDTVSGDDDTVSGDDDTASGDDDTASGDDDTASGDDDTSTGGDTPTGDDDTALGDDDGQATPDATPDATPAPETSPTPGPDPTPTPVPAYAPSEGDNMQMMYYTQPNGFYELLDVESAGGYLYMTGQGGIIIWSLSNPYEPKQISAVETDRAYRLHLVDNVLYQTGREYGLMAIDVSNPADPGPATPWLRESVSFEGIDVVDNIIFVAAHDAGIWTYRYNGPGAQMSLLESFGGFTNAWELRIRDGLAFVADGEAGLKVVDVSDPSNLVIKAALDLPGIAQDIVFGEGNDEGYVYVALGSDGVAIIDILNPLDPVLMSIYEGRGTAYSIDYEYGALYVAAWTAIEVVDVSDPTLPVQAATEMPRESAMAIYANQYFSYLADWTQISAYSYNPGYRSAEIHLNPMEFNIPMSEDGSDVYEALVVYNDGYFPLVVDEIKFSNGDCTYGDGPIEVEPYGSAIAEFKCLGRDYSYVVDMEVRSNDPDEGLLRIPVNYAPPGTTPGNEAPNFILPDLNYYNHELEAYRGEVVMLAFFATF